VCSKAAQCVGTWGFPNYVFLLTSTLYLLQVSAEGLIQSFRHLTVPDIWIFSKGHNERQDLKTGRCAAWKMVSTRRLVCLFHAVLRFPSGQGTLWATARPANW
jgi:hypothetical protein